MAFYPIPSSPPIASLNTYIYLLDSVVEILMTRLSFYNNMPQLVPFYFVNQVTFTFLILVSLIYVFSKYILPRFVRLFSTRVFISKL